MPADDNDNESLMKGPDDEQMTSSGPLLVVCCLFIDFLNATQLNVLFYHSKRRQ